MTEVTAATFDTAVLAADQPVLVDFWAPWCGPCLAMRPNLEKLGREMDGRLIVVKVNVQDEQSMTTRFNFTNIPTLILFRGGQEVARRSGAAGLPALRDFVEKSLG